jgi:hemolysin III
MQPDYSRNERLVDGAVHILGVTGSAVAIVVLFDTVLSTGDKVSILSAGLYGAGLVAMLWLSAAYNLISQSKWKEAIRRYDHAGIFLMIAGTYTPFALIAIGGVAGHALFALVWLAAVAGMLLKLLRPRRLERTSVALYLALGWFGLPLVKLVIAALPNSTLALLGIGGLLYTAGVAFHLWERLPFQNAIWHSFVLAAAGCHYVAVLKVLRN